MANDHRQPQNYFFGTLTTAVAVSDVTLAASVFAALPTTYSASVYMPLVLHDPSTAVFEVVWVTAHAGSATTVTVLRGREGTAARAWPSGTQVVCAPTIRDGLFWVSTRASLPADAHVGLRCEIADEGVVVEKVATGWVQLADSPVAQLRQTTLQAVPTATWTAATFQTVDVDNRGGWSAGSPTRYTSKADGVYSLGGGSGWTANVTGSRAIRWMKNGAAISGGVGPSNDPAQSSVSIARPIFVRLLVGEYVEMQLYQSSGGNLNTMVATAENQATMSVRWVGA